MPVVAITGKQFTVKVGTTDHSAQVTNGSINRAGTTETIQTLAGSATISQGVEDGVTADFLYDGASGFYKTLFDAAGAGTALSVEIVGDDGEWTGSLTVASVSNEFPADGASTCSAELAGALTFATATP